MINQQQVTDAIALLDNAVGHLALKRQDHTKLHAAVNLLNQYVKEQAKLNQDFVAKVSVADAPKYQEELRPTLPPAREEIHD